MRLNVRAVHNACMMILLVTFAISAALATAISPDFGIAYLQVLPLPKAQSNGRSADDAQGGSDGQSDALGGRAWSASAPNLPNPGALRA